MSNPVPAPAPSPARRPVHWPSLAMVVIGMGGLLLLLSFALTSFLAGVVSLFNPISNALDAPQLFSYTVGGVSLSLLLLPGIVMGIRRLGGHSGEKLPTFFERIVRALHPRRLVWLYPLVVLAGWLLERYPTVNWLFMPLLNFFALAMPVALLVWIGTRGFEPHSAQRDWSVLGVSMTATVALIFVLEIIVLAAGMIAIAILATALPSSGSPVLQEIIRALEQIGLTGKLSEQTVFHLLQNPVVIGVALLFISGVVPLLEEIFKPLAVWALWKRPLTPQEGWTLGLLSGAGFAIMENFGNVSVGEGWTFLVLGRAGATTLHMFNTALIGYTFVLALRNKRKWLPVFALAVAMLVHAAWNAMTVFAVVGTLDSPMESEIWPLRYLILMVLMSLSMLAGIILVNRQLAQPKEKTNAPEADETGEPVEVTEIE